MLAHCKKYPPTPPTPLSCCVMTAYQAYVDIKYGNDALASLESPARPFRTIPAAIDAIVLTRGVNVTEPWIINISIGQFPSLLLNGVDAITFQGSGTNTVIGGITLLNSGQLSPIIARQIKVSPLIGLLKQGDEPLLDVRLSVFQVFDSVLEVSSDATNSAIISRSSELNVLRSDIRGRISAGKPLIDLVDEGSTVSFNDNHFEVVVEDVPQIASTEPIAIYRNSSTDPNTSLLSIGNQFNAIGIAAGQLLSFATTETSNGLVIGANDTFRIIDQPQLVQRLRNSHQHLQKILFKENLQQVVGSYAIAEHLGQGKVVVSNNRVAGEVEINISNNLGTGTLLLQNTAYGDNAIPTTTITGSVDNGTDKGGSLWYSGAFSINAKQVDSTQPYEIKGDGDDYAIYVIVDGATIILPSLTDRKGRILEIVLSLKADGELAKNCTVVAEGGQLIYSLLDAPSPAVILGSPPPIISLNKLRLQSTPSGTGNIWFNLF